MQGSLYAGTVHPRAVRVCAAADVANPPRSVPKSRQPCDAPFKTIIEPFRIKLVETLEITDRRHRQELLAQAIYNIFKIPAES